MDMNVGSVIANLRLDSKQFTDELKRTQEKFASALTKMVNVAKKIAVRITAAFRKMVHTISKWVKRAVIAIIAYTAASLKAFASFEDAMVRSAAVTENAVGAMQDAMSKAARQMAKESILSAKELAEGYFALGQAGFTAARSIKALPVVADFAIASQVKLDQATRYLVRTLEGLGMASENPIKNMMQLERVSNSFTYAAIKTTAEIEDFAVAMTHAAAPALRLVNKSMEEGTAVLMAFARAGIVGEEAGTLLWTTVRDLQRASIKAREEWKNLGIEVYDANGKMRNLAELLGDLEKEFSGMSDEGKKVNLMLLGFQDRSLRGIQALMGFSKEMKEFQGDMENLSKLTREIAEKYQKSFKAAMIMAWHQITDLSIAFGQKLAPAIRGLAKDFERNQEVFKKWVERVASYMASAIEHVRKFVRYIRYDMEGGIQLGLDIVKQLFISFGDALFVIGEEIFVKFGANILVWFERGFANRLEFNKLSQDLLNKAMGVKSNWERHLKTLMMDKDDFDKYTEQVAESQKKAMDKLATGYFQKVGREAFPTIPINFEVVGKSLENIAKEAKAKITELKKESGWGAFLEYDEAMEKWRDWWTDVKKGSKPFIDTLQTVKYELMDMMGLMGTIKKVNAFDSEIPAIQELRQILKDMNKDLQFQSELIGKTVDERSKLTAMMSLQRLIEEKLGDATSMTADEQKRYNEIMKEYGKTLDDLLEKQKSFLSFTEKIKQWTEDATNMWENFGSIAVSALDSTADAIATLAETGKADFRSLAVSILQDLNRMIIRMMMAKMIMSAMGMSPNLSITGPTNAGVAPSPSVLSGNLGSALGNIFNAGKIMAFANGGIINQPTLAPMALMGEAGPEAIMPLSRTSSGALGVKAQQPNISFNPQIKAIFVKDDREAMLETMRSAPGEKVIVQKVIRNRNTLG